MQIPQSECRRIPLLTLAAILIFSFSCHRSPAIQSVESSYPPAFDAQKVGSYPARTKSGAGYFYDEVLEYRVWIKPPAGGAGYYKAFARYEDALTFSKKMPGAEEPLVLILQKEWIDEPQPGIFSVKNEDRITEWKVEWLANSKRTPGATDRFLEEHRSGVKSEGKK